MSAAVWIRIPAAIPATSAPHTSDAGERRPRTARACAKSAAARPGMSLRGRTPEIENSGASASSDTVPATSARGARSRSAGNTSSRARQNIAAATIASAPASRDHTASATASSRIGASDDPTHESAASERCPSPMYTG